jgi:hypothetical protein
MTPLMTVENFFAVAMFVILILIVILCSDESEGKPKMSLQQDGRYAIVGR